MDTNAPPGIEGFSSLPAIAHVEADRYCEGCGYNLIGQPVKQDPRTNLLMACCPECGFYLSAKEAVTSPHAWLQRFLIVPASMGIFTMVLFCFYAAWGLGATVYIACGVIVGELEPPFVYGASLQMALWHGVGFALGGTFLITTVMSMLSTVVTPHWSRRHTRLFNMCWPLAVTAIGAVAYGKASMYPVSLVAVTPILTASALGVMGGALLGTLGGRPFARSVVRVVLAPQVRTVFGYLWTADGLEPPATKKHTLRGDHSN